MSVCPKIGGPHWNPNSNISLDSLDSLYFGLPTSIVWTTPEWESMGICSNTSRLFGFEELTPCRKLALPNYRSSWTMFHSGNSISSWSEFPSSSSKYGQFNPVHHLKQHLFHANWTLNIQHCHCQFIANSPRIFWLTQHRKPLSKPRWAPRTAACRHSRTRRVDVAWTRKVIWVEIHWKKVHKWIPSMGYRWLYWLVVWNIFYFPIYWE